MPNTTPFSFSPGTEIPTGTQRTGNILHGTPELGFSDSELKWWNGPDEDLGYVVALEDPTGTTIGADGEAAYINFSRSTIKTEASFIEMINDIFNQNFTTGDAAKSWLNDNGYWTSWGLTPNEETELLNAIITSNNEYITLGEGTYLAYNI